MATVDLHPDFSGFLNALNLHEVRYLVLGGYAVIHYGYHRVTSDLDVWISTDAVNARRVSLTLQEWGAFAPEVVPPKLFEHPDARRSFGRKPVQIDILTAPSGVAFEECYSRRNEVVWDGVTVPLISRDDLVRNKIASGRNKDLADLEYLPRRQPRE